MQQLLLFPETTEQVLQREVKSIREQCEKIRKGQFAKISLLTQQVKDLEDELRFLKKEICTPKRLNDQLELF